MARIDTISYTHGLSRIKILLLAGGVGIILALILGVAIGVPLSQRSEDPALDTARKVLSQVPLIDGHNDLPWRIFANTHNRLTEVDLSRGMQGVWNITHTDIPRLRHGQVGAQFWAVYVGCKAQNRDIVRQCFEQADIARRFIDQYDSTLKFVTSAQGIEEAFKEGKIGSLLGMEGGHCIDSSLGALRMFYQVGVRYMTLTHNCDTPWADNNRCDHKDYDGKCQSDGLSEFGKVVVREMNRLGMFIDISHTSHRLMEVTLETSRAPVIFSHSSAYALCNHQRNVRDDILNKMKENGGVVMVTFVPSFVTCPPGYPKGTNSTLAHVADHIEHVRDVAGIDHVGIGSDYDGIPTVPEGLEDVSTFPNLFAELVRRGWSEEDLGKLAGNNLLRAMKKMEEVRDSLNNEAPNEDYLEENQLNMTCRTPFPN